MPRSASYPVRAELVGSILEVLVEVGAVVAEGDEVALLESMKMEIPIIADVAGTVSAVSVVPGDVVQEGDVLLELTTGGPAAP